MNNEVFPAQDSTLSAEALRDALISMYALPRESECQFHRKGICDTYRIQAREERFFLKVYRSRRRTRRDVLEEVRLLQHLLADGISVAAPVKQVDGQYVSDIAAPEGVRSAVLFRAAAGEPDRDGNLERIKAFGKVIGRMHLSCDSFRPSYDRTPLDMNHLIDENVEAISEIMRHRQKDLSLIRGIGEELKHMPLLEVRDAPQFGICHGDLHGGDVMYDADNRPTIFDFDSSGCGWRALDIGVFPASLDWMDTSAEKDAIRRRRLEAFLDGYAGVRSLTDEELCAVDQMAAVRHIYLMGFVLRYSVVWNGGYWVDDDFIDWHMRWFRKWKIGVT